MKKIAMALGFGLMLVSWAGHAQPINDCENAEVVCDNSNLAFNPDGPGHNDFADPDNNPGCMVALEQNSAWYYFQIDPNAPPNLELGFTIHPNGGLGEDYDWALFGPDVTCGNLGSPIRCSSSSAACGFCPETGMGMGAMDLTEGPGTGDGFVMTLIVQPGQGFYLLIDNWLGTTNGFILEWTGSASDYLNCNAHPPCALEAHAGNDIGVCEGETFQLNGSSTGNQGNETYVWSGTNGGTGFLDDPMTQSPSGELPQGFSGMLTYTLTVTEDTCTSEDEMIVTVYPLPTVTINPAGPFCPNQQPQSLTATPAGGVWGGAASGSTFNPMTNGPGTHTVTYTYTDSHGCMGMASMDIVVYDGPEVAIEPVPAAFCADDVTILLTAETTGGAPDYTYQWNTPTGNGTADTYLAMQAGSHAVTVTDANGCTDSVAVNVVIHPNPVIVINDPGPICGSLPFLTITAAPTGGTFDGDFISPQGDLIPNMIMPGTYTISYTFTDNNNCESTEYMQYTIIPVPEAFASNNGPVCAGQPFQLLGSTNGTGATSWFWTGPNGYTSNQQNPMDATVGGTYFLEVVVEDCPSAQVMTTVIVHDLPEAIASNGGPYCNGETIQLMGSTNESGVTITYTWTGPNGFISDVQNPTNATEPGTYTLIVSVDGCASLPVSTDVIFSSSPDATATNSGPYCAGDAIALFGNTTTPGVNIIYQWTGPNGYVSAVQNPIDATEPGAYQLIVNVDGCASVAASTTVVIHPSPQPVIMGQSTFCTGFSSMLDAGSGYASYVWDDSSTLQVREVFVSGTYAVTVTDVNGCTGSAQFDVVENNALMPTITGTLAFCAGTSTMLDAGAGFTTYAWSTGETTQTVQVSGGGNIGVTVTDVTGCTGVDAVTTIEHPNPNVMIGGSTTYCIGGSTTLDAGTYASYLWSNDSTTQAIVINTPGIYAVTVIDQNGCSGSASVNVDESTSLNPVITGNPAFCENGSTTLNAGSGFATYLWSDNSTSQTLTVSVAGTYSVTVSDGQGCSGEASVNIIEVAPPSAILVPADTLCNTSAGGSVINLYSLVLSGDITGSWQDIDNSGAAGLFSNLSFTGVAAGEYRFLYTTNSAMVPCPEETYEVVITVLECTCPDLTITNPGPLCNADGMLNVSTLVNTMEAGVWSVLQTPAGSNPAILNGAVLNATGADPGAYILQFSFLNPPPPGCLSDFDVPLQVDPAVSSGVAAAPLSLCAGDDQLVQLVSLLTAADPGGIWKETSVLPSQGAAFDAVNGVFNTGSQQAGTYTFLYTVAASGICPDDETEVTVVIAPAPVALIQPGVVIDCANPIQTLDATGSSAGPGFAIDWAGSGIVIDGNEHTLQPTIDQAGVYQLTITHIASGCSGTASVTVMANTDPPTGAVIQSSGPGCVGETNGFIHVNQVIGGASPYLYNLNGGAFAVQGDFDLLNSGVYTLGVEDANGCRWDTAITLAEPVSVNIEVGDDIALDLGESATVQAMINLPLNEIDTLIWSPDDILTCIDFACLEAEVHTFGSVTLTATVYDINGCESSDQLRITVNRDRHVFIPNVFSPNSDQHNDVFYIQGDPDQIVEVGQFRVYDRWGALVYEQSHFQPNDEAYGWDGHDHRNGVMPGVFSYLAEIIFIDGYTATYSGDVTLVR